MSALKPAELLHEGKAKKVFRTNYPGVVVVQYKDDATAFNAQKKAQLAGKGLLNWEISARVFEALEADGIASHYLGCLAPGWMAVKEVAIVPVEVVLRNRAAGSLCRQLPITPGTVLEPALLDLYYKDDELGDPLLTEARLELLGLLTPQDREELERLARAVNAALQKRLEALDIELVDFKLEFGRVWEGDIQRIILADEISPDNCRLWDVNSNEKLDKDRFRQNLGGLVDAYQEVARRLGIFSSNGHDGKKGPVLVS